MAEVSNDPRTYGNWRKPGGGGLFGLSKGATYVGLGFVGVSMLVTIAAGAIVGFSLMFGGLAMLAACSIPLAPHDRTLMRTVVPVVAHAWDRTSAQTSRRVDPLISDGVFKPPGLAATSELSEYTDAQGRPFAIVSLPKRNLHTVVFHAFPDGGALVDEDQVDVWVARWGMWLAALGDEPGLIAASVTVETSPDSGERLKRELAATTKPDAPEAARRMLSEIAEAYPTGSAMINATVTLTFRGVRGWNRPDKIALAGRVTHFAAELHGTGAGSARPMTAAELCERVRTAYDPDAQEAFDDARAHGEQVNLTWDEVGPVASDNEFSHYRHDSGVSVTWAMTAPPRGNVTADVLVRLLRPHPELARKRVTLLYRPLDSSTASRVVEDDARDAEATVRNARRPTARQLAERDSAQHAAREEANGAGLTNFAVLITATTTSVDRLPDLRRVIRQLAPTARLRIRPAYGWQEAAFTAGLPLGVVLKTHRTGRMTEGG
jgi:hypothetical protein